MELRFSWILLFAAIEWVLDSDVLEECCVGIVWEAGVLCDYKLTRREESDNIGIYWTVETMIEANFWTAWSNALLPLCYYIHMWSSRISNPKLIGSSSSSGRCNSQLELNKNAACADNANGVVNSTEGRATNWITYKRRVVVKPVKRPRTSQR